MESKLAAILAATIAFRRWARYAKRPPRDFRSLGTKTAPQNEMVRASSCNGHARNGRCQAFAFTKARTAPMTCA